MDRSSREPSARRVHRLPGGDRMVVGRAARTTCTVTPHATWICPQIIQSQSTKHETSSISAHN